MPRIETIRVGLLWLSVNVSDHGDLSFARLGLTLEHSYERCIRALMCSEGDK